MLVHCACDCGETFEERDAHGRPRTFVRGHNKRVERCQLRDATLGVLSEGPAPVITIWQRLGGLDSGRAPVDIRAALHKARRRGLVKKNGEAWALVPPEERAA